MKECLVMCSAREQNATILNHNYVTLCKIRNISRLIK